MSEVVPTPPRVRAPARSTHTCTRSLPASYPLTGPYPRLPLRPLLRSGGLGFCLIIVVVGTDEGTLLILAPASSSAAGGAEPQRDAAGRNPHLALHEDQRAQARLHPTPPPVAAPDPEPRSSSFPPPQPQLLLEPPPGFHDHEPRSRLRLLPHRPPMCDAQQSCLRPSSLALVLSGDAMRCGRQGTNASGGALL